MTGKLNNAWNSTVIRRKKSPNLQKYTCSVNARSVSWTFGVKPNSHDKLLRKNNGPLRVF